MSMIIKKPILSIKHLSMVFGGLRALNDISLDVEAGVITSIIGPNGAGKTTLFNCITGFYTPTHGMIALDKSPNVGANNDTHGNIVYLERLEDHQVAKAGIARTFQNIRLFPRMTVLENLLVASHNELMKKSWFSFKSLFGYRSYKKAEAKYVERAAAWLEKIGLLEWANEDAGNLSYGDQRKLEIARAMCTNPKILCLDEPAAGLNPAESQELNQLLMDIKNEFKTTILLIEHDMGVVMNISDHIIVLDHGEKIADGTPTDVKNDPKVIRAYLGEEDDADIPTEIAQDLHLNQS